MFVKVKTHKQSYRIADSIGVIGTDPFPDIWYQIICMGRKGFGRPAVAGGPVVYIGQESLDLSYGSLKILRSGYNECVKVILIIIFVRKLG